MARFSRPQSPDGHSRTSTLELFYDLVFVFAVTQISHTLFADLRWEVAGQQAVVLLAVWWSWNYTTWATNELNTDAVPVRALVVAVMLGSLLMSIAIPEAWGERALLFVGAYVAIQIGRHLFMTFVVGEPGSRERDRSGRITVWFCASGIPWLLGGIVDGPARTVLWLIALAIDYVAPVAVYRVPWMPRVKADVWEVTTEHFAERFQLFVIIALGESIVVTGASTSKIDPLDVATVGALVVAFLSSAALWWLYFNRAAEGSQRQLEMADNRTELARDVYTYLHAIVVAGVIVSAIGDEIVIQHHGESLPTAELIAVVAGPAIFLLALALIRLRATGTGSLKRPVAATLIALIGLVAAGAPALAVAILVLVVLVALIAVEEWTHHRPHADGSPTEREIFEAEAR